jgi:hypothetical protein
MPDVVAGAGQKELAMSGLQQRARACKSVLLHAADLQINKHGFWRISIRQKNGRIVIDTRRWRRLPDGSVKSTGAGFAASVENWLELLAFCNRVVREARR